MTADFVIYAFYDLSVNPNSFDITKFLVLADLDRRDRGFDSIHVAIVPSGSGWARDDDEHGTSGQEWRMRNILLPALGLMASVSGYTICASRYQAREMEAVAGADIFPSGHTVDAPVSCFEWADIAIRSDSLFSSLRASDQARAYARQWIDDRANGRRVIAITLREMDLSEGRNTDLKATAKFANSLDEGKHFPVIIRDTQCALETTPSELAGLPMFNEAAFNLDLRMGFYEECYLNIFVSNGPAEVCIFNTAVSYLMFLKVPDINTGEFLKNIPSFGLEKGQKFFVGGPHQQVVWKPDTVENLDTYFRSTITEIEANKGEVVAYNSRTTFPPVEQDIVVACSMLAFAGRTEHVRRLMDRKIDELGAEAGSFLLKVALCLMRFNRLEQAKLFVDETLALAPNIKIQNLRTIFKDDREMAMLVAIMAADRGIDYLRNFVRQIKNDIDIDDDERTFVLRVAHGLLDIGDVGTAKIVANEAFDANPDRGEAFELRGELSIRLGNLAAGIRDFRKACRCSRDLVLPAIKLSMALMAAGELDEAELTLRQWLDRGVQIAAVYKTLSAVMKQKGDDRAAVEFEMRAAESA